MCSGKAYFFVHIFLLIFMLNDQMTLLQNDFFSLSLAQKNAGEWKTAKSAGGVCKWKEKYGDGGGGV